MPYLDHLPYVAARILSMVLVFVQLDSGKPHAPLSCRVASNETRSPLEDMQGWNTKAENLT